MNSASRHAGPLFPAGWTQKPPSACSNETRFCFIKEAEQKALLIIAGVICSLEWGGKLPLLGRGGSSRRAFGGRRVGFLPLFVSAAFTFVVDF